jgi:ABC-type transport system substrate-binding protein
MMKKWFNFVICALMLMIFCVGCGDNPGKNPPCTMHINAGGRVKTLDPALASDLSSRNMVASFYDTLLQYDYTVRPYKLIPSMLAEMPRSNRDMTVYKFKLRDDLFFQDDPCFKGAPRYDRKVTSKDVVYSFLRIADGRLHSPVFWMFRGKIKGIDKFRERTAVMPPGNNSAYAEGISGFKVIDGQNFEIHLSRPDPRFLYALAIPYASIVSHTAVEFYGESFSEHPVGSGPFRLTQWIRDYRLVLDRNPEYRTEYFRQAASPADRSRPLPLLDRIVVYIIKQPLSAWLLFLQGELDMSTLSKDNFDTVVGGGRMLVPALVKRGIKLIQVPEFEVRYIGFNFTDPVLADNLNLRKAISLAYNIDNRIKHFNNQIIAAQGPIPPGVAGFDPDFENLYSKYNVKKAREYMVKAGYPNGIDPKTGKPLTLTFDQNGNSTSYRQLAELMVSDMKKLGIKIEPRLNNKPRFFQKIRKGKFQLFRLSWIGDYPDAENFLQLFYGKNAGSCNRVFYRDPKFDCMFERIIPMADSDKRTKLYKRMVKYITSQCPWIFESFPISYELTHAWLENFIPHDFAFARWKYLSIDEEQRVRTRKAFKPLSLEDLRK